VKQENAYEVNVVYFPMVSEVVFAEAICIETRHSTTPQETHKLRNIVIAIQISRSEA